MSQKWSLQDIKPANASRERLQQIPIKKPRLDIGIRTPVQDYVQETKFDPDVSSIDIIDGNSKKRSRIIISICLAIFILGVTYLINVFIGGAEITVYPKFKDTAVQASFVAYKTPQSGQLSFELLSLEETGERQITATGQEHVSERSTGKILIYNTKLPSTQRLIKNTRFETSDGLIFRIKESVEVPGVTKDTKGNIVSGVVTADVFADGAGEQYNIKPSRFTLPGLKGSEQFDVIYAESTSDFSNGYEGDKYIMDETELEKVKQELQLELRNKLLQELSTSLPSGFIAYDQAVTLTFESLPATSYGDQLATIKEKALLRIPIFKDKEFAKYIAKNTIVGFEDEDVLLTDPKSLVFSFAVSTTTISDISAYQEMHFRLNGNTQIVWQFDIERLKSDLLGLPKSSLQNVLSSYTAINKAEAIVRPFWSQSFPKKTESMVVHKVLSGS